MTSDSTISTNPLVDTFTYRVDPFDADFKGQLSWDVLGKRILSAASLHADKRGFNSIVKDGTAYLWVLSRMVVEVNRWPRVGEQYSISTWVKTSYRFFSERCFALTDAQGHQVGQVLTIWAMINSLTRQPELLDHLFEHSISQYAAGPLTNTVERSRRLRANSTTPLMERPTYYSDIDTNGHVNSIRYIEYLLDAFPLSHYVSHQVSRLEMDYVAESYQGDTLKLYLDPPADDHPEGVAEMRKANANDEETVCCRCAVRFAPRHET